MHRETRASMAACMRRAWELVRLTNALHRKGYTTIVYKMLNGKVNKAIGTLNMGPGLSNGEGNSSPKVFTYYDLQRCGIRSFRLENLISFY